MMMSDEVLKTTQEICAKLQISRQTLWRLQKSHPTMPGLYMVGRTARWSERELMEWLGNGVKH
nr:helix-turn-helix domain-containing protein [Pseudomonas jilinensis]